MSEYEINHETKNLTVCVGRATISGFVKLVEDKNKIHTDPEIAKSRDFEDTPIPGTLLHAYFEQLALNHGFKPKNYSLKFKNPAYPDEPLTFRKTLEEDGKLELVCLNGKGETIAYCKSDSSSSSIDKKNNGKLISSYTHKISEIRRNSFCSLLNLEFNGGIPLSLVSSSIPSSLLCFLFGKTGNYGGVYRRIEFNLHNPPKLGDLKIDLYVQRMKPIGDKFIYDIAGECFQDGERVLSSNVKVTTNFDLKIS